MGYIKKDFKNNLMGKKIFKTTLIYIPLSLNLLQKIVPKHHSLSQVEFSKVSWGDFIGEIKKLNLGFTTAYSINKILVLANTIFIYHKIYCNRIKQIKKKRR